MIQIIDSDKRSFELKYSPGFPYNDIILKMSQLDLLRIIRALEKVHNQTIKLKFIKFITAVDKFEKVKTNFNRNTARRNI